MSLHSDLLEQAKYLLNRERTRPKQASLRRAISAAYYALFHLLIEDASRLILRGTSLGEFQPRLARAFVHGEMKQVSQAFTKAGQGTKLAPEIDAMIRALSNPPADLQTVASTFVDLQQNRHDADYDTGRKFKRSEVEVLVDSAGRAFEAWDRTKGSPLAQAYLIALLFSKKWGHH